MSQDTRILSLQSFALERAYAAREARFSKLIDLHREEIIDLRERLVKTEAERDDLLEALECAKALFQPELSTARVGRRVFVFGK